MTAALVIVCFSATGLCLDYPSLDGWYDSYGEIPWKKEVLHLDNFAIDLRRYPAYLGYVAIYAGKRDSVDSVKARVARVKEYLVSKGRIEESRIIVLEAGRKEKVWTILQPVDKDKPPPDFGL